MRGPSSATAVSGAAAVIVAAPFVRLEDHARRIVSRDDGDQIVGMPAVVVEMLAAPAPAALPGRAPSCRGEEP